MKKRLLEVCPSYLSTSGISYYRPENQQPKQPDVFLLKFWCCYDRKGLLHGTFVVVETIVPDLKFPIGRTIYSTYGINGDDHCLRGMYVDHLFLFFPTINKTDGSIIVYTWNLKCRNWLNFVWVWHTAGEREAIHL